MDPLTALSVAGTIIQFIDFGSKILNTTHQVYKSATGASLVNEELEVVAGDLTKLITKLRRPLGSTSSVRSKGTSLEELCNACSAVAAELIKRLDGLKAKGRSKPWESFRAALRAAWTENELEALKTRLASFQAALEMHVIVDLR